MVLQAVVEQVVLGIDPGCVCMGYGIVSGSRSQQKLLAYGTITHPAGMPLYRRVGRIFRVVEEQIIQYKVTVLALETAFMGKNAQNFLKLGYVRGALYLLQDKYDLVLHEFAPTQVKQGVTGYGAAHKEQVAHLVARLFPELCSSRAYDMTDAVAVGLCALWQSQRSPLFVP